jgi:hypothetical protein
MKSIKADLIRKYMAAVDFRGDDWSIHTMAQEMKSFLGEQPSVDVTYRKDVMVTELTGTSREIKMVDKVTVVFTDTDDKIKKMDFKV